MCSVHGRNVNSYPDMSLRQGQASSQVDQAHCRNVPSIWHNATMLCNLEYHESTPPNVNTYLLVDLHVFTSITLLESQNPCNSNEPFT